MRYNSLWTEIFRLFQVHAPAQACAKCGWVAVDLKQADELRRRTVDAYRKKHGLLTSDEIRALRKFIGMNQRDFARLLGVGEASVKRWETWLVQENSSDQLIRMKCAPRVRSTLVQPGVTTVWISFHCPLQERSAGIRTAPGDYSPVGRCTAPVFPASRWKLPVETHDPADQDELELHDLDESTADAGEKTYAITTYLIRLAFNNFRKILEVARQWDHSHGQSGVAVPLPQVVCWRIVGANIATRPLDHAGQQRRGGGGLPEPSVLATSS